MPIEYVLEFLVRPTLGGRLAAGGGDHAGDLAALDPNVAPLSLWDEGRWRGDGASRGLTPTHASTSLSPSEIRPREVLGEFPAGLRERPSRGSPPIAIRHNLVLRQRRPPLGVRYPAAVLHLAAAVGPGARDDPPIGACPLLTARTRAPR